MALLWNYLKQYKKILFGALFLATINQVFSLLDPQIFRILIDHYANKSSSLTPTDYLQGVGLLLLASMFVAFVSRVAKSFQDYYTNVIIQRLGTKLYNDSVAHSFAMPFAVFEDQRSGEFLSKLEIARSDSTRLIQSVINILFFTIVGILFVLIYAFIVHWSIGLVYLIMIPLLGTLTFWITKKIRSAQKEIVTATQSLAGSTTETLRNVELVKSLGLEIQEINRLNTVNEQILTLELQKVRLLRTYDFIQGTLINGLRMGLMLLMMWLIFTTKISLGEFFSLLLYSFFIFNPLSMVGSVATNYHETKASLEKLEEILAQDKEKTPDHPTSISKVQSITFNDVSFRYQSAVTDSLQNINLTINAGKTVAFVGPSGSGKSTLIKLIVGLYKPVSGTIFYNQATHSEIDFTTLRKKIGLVSQDTQLFAGTIRENLLFIQPLATDEECLKALTSANVNSLLEKSGQGLDTKIGEGGLKLSGGEKQRLAIARALLRKPDILIFDEATSSLDSITEEQIINTIKKIELEQPQLIRILIAHRLSTIIHADIIYVLEKGRLIEQGAHNELMKLNGLYSAMWRQQLAS